MKAGTLKFNVSYFSFVPKIVPGVDVRLKDTEGPAISFRRDLDTRNQICFGDVKIADEKIWSVCFHNHLVARCHIQNRLTPQYSCDQGVHRGARRRRGVVHARAQRVGGGHRPWTQIQGARIFWCQFRRQPHKTPNCARQNPLREGQIWSGRRFA